MSGPRCERLSETVTLYCGDCRDVLPTLSAPDAAIFTDPPYGMTDAAWDVALEPGVFWRALKRGHEGAVFVLTASQPFTSLLVASNLADFRCEWIWEKNAGSNFGTVKWQPMKEHENVLVFCSRAPAYFPIMEERAPSGSERVKTVVNYDSQPEAYSGIKGKASSLRPELRYPRSIRKFNRERGLHPNQKPVGLFEYLIKTYTTEGQIVLDPFMGAGTTGVAAQNLDRPFVGIESNQGYFDAVCRRLTENARRLAETSRQSSLFARAHPTTPEPAR